jgi:hypothetical protein
MKSTTIPFSGFYGSLHSIELDDTLDQMFSDRGTGSHVNDGLVAHAIDKINWQATHIAYAQEYCEQFALEMGVTLNFEALVSPREYNFVTDRIFASISCASLERLYAVVDKNALVDMVRVKFTSRDGFASFYPNELGGWPADVQDWDHNQIGTLIETLVGKGFDQFKEHDLMSDSRSNGFCDSILEQNLPCAERLFKIHDYLQVRAAR